MNINWFPGHMTKSLRMMQDNIKLVDAVIYVLDARAAYSCLNPALNEMAKNKPIVYVVNKADLVEKFDLNTILEYFKKNNLYAIPLNSTASRAASLVSSSIKKMCAEKIERNLNKGVRAVIRAMVVGIPNSGKSTLINNLYGSAATNTGNKAGVTRGKQWIKIGEYFEVLDTPGTLYPKLSNQEKARRLAYIGSINDDILDKHELALNLIEELDKIDPKFISLRYKICEAESSQRLEMIAKSRGFIRMGGEADQEKAAVAVIDDFRKGRMGKIALEK